MSVTVFPVTDQTVTTSLFFFLKIVADRGTTDPLSGASDTANDSARLSMSYAAGPGATTGVADYKTAATLPIDAGMAFYGELQGAISFVDNGGVSGDPLNVRVTAPSGVRVVGRYVTQSTAPSGPPIFGRFDITGTNTSFAIINTGDATNVPVFFYFVAYGISGSGNITFEYVKASDAEADDWQMTDIRCHMVRVLG